MAKNEVFHRDDDIMSDNTHANYCDTCRDCTMWGMDENDYFSNQHNKSNCSMYPYPGVKPGYVINNQAPCPFKVPGRGKG